MHRSTSVRFFVNIHAIHEGGSCLCSKTSISKSPYIISGQLFTLNYTLRFLSRWHSPNIPKALLVICLLRVYQTVHRLGYRHSLRYSHSFCKERVDDLGNAAVDPRGLDPKLADAISTRNMIVPPLLVQTRRILFREGLAAKWPVVSHSVKDRSIAYSFTSHRRFSILHLSRCSAVEAETSVSEETDSDKEEEERLWFRPYGEDTGIVVRNGLTRSKVPLILKKKSVSWYMCGPTVYDDAHIGKEWWTWITRSVWWSEASLDFARAIYSIHHIFICIIGRSKWSRCRVFIVGFRLHVSGHASCYVRFDVIRRILSEFFGLDVVLVMGITDIDDKIITRSKILGQSPIQIAKQYERYVLGREYLRVRYFPRIQLQEYLAQMNPRVGKSHSNGLWQ